MPRDYKKERRDYYGYGKYSQVVDRKRWEEEEEYRWRGGHPGFRYQ